MDKFSIPKENIKIILIGFAVVIVGYLLMAGGGSDDPAVFNPEIFSPVRMTVSPILIVAGFAVIFYGVMRRPKKSNPAESDRK